MGPTPVIQGDPRSVPPKKPQNLTIVFQPGRLQFRAVGVPCGVLTVTTIPYHWWHQTPNPYEAPSLKMWGSSCKPGTVTSTSNQIQWFGCPFNIIQHHSTSFNIIQHHLTIFPKFDWPNQWSTHPAAPAQRSPSCPSFRRVSGSGGWGHSGGTGHSGAVGRISAAQTRCYVGMTQNPGTSVNLGEPWKSWEIWDSWTNGCLMFNHE